MTSIGAVQNAGIDEYYLSFLSSLLRIKEHRDFALWAQEVERLVTEFSGTDDFYFYDLWETSIATRDYSTAEEQLSKMPGNADDPDTLHPYTTKLRKSIYTYYFLGKQEELALAASQLRSAIDGRRDPDGGVHASWAILDLALVEVVGGNTDEAMRLVRSWRRAASTDLADISSQRSISCAILGVAAATVETVECLREAFAEPSYAMPFIDPFYPHYDSIRDEPEFVELLAEFDEAL